MSELATPAAAQAAKPVTSTILAALNKALTDAFEADPKMLALGEDLADPEEGGIVGVTKGLSTLFGDDRVRSTPIS
jgi:pyruvate dehydrogenase E1 component beta subunit